MTEGPRRSEHLSTARLLAYGLALAAVVVVAWGMATSGGAAELSRAVVLGALLVLWVAGVGGALTALRYPVAGWLRRLPVPWAARFLTSTLVLLAALVGLWVTLDAVRRGAAVGAGDVVWPGALLLGSVALLGLWTAALWRWRFTPAAVALLFGVHGALAVAVIRGPAALWEAPVWILCFGVVCWVPARAIHDRPGARPSGSAYAFVALVPIVLLGLAWLVVWAGGR